MKKILTKITFLIALLVISPCICMAWTDENIKKHYEDKFGTKYTDSSIGLRAIIYMLSNTTAWSNIDDMQNHLEKHYEKFKKKFDTVDMQILEDKYIELKKYHSQKQQDWQDSHHWRDSHPGYELFKGIKALGNFDEGMQEHRMKEIIKAIQFSGTKIKQNELLSIAQCVSEKTSVELDREAKRRKSVLLKWFDDNWDQILPTLQFVRMDMRIDVEKS